MNIRLKKIRVSNAILKQLLVNLLIFQFSQAAFSNQSCQSALEALSPSSPGLEFVWTQLYDEDDLNMRSESARRILAKRRFRLRASGNNVLDHNIRDLLKSRSLKQYEAFKDLVKIYSYLFYESDIELSILRKEEAPRQKISAYPLIRKQTGQPLARGGVVTQSFSTNLESEPLALPSDEVVRLVENNAEKSTSFYSSNLALFSHFPRFFMWREKVEAEESSSFTHLIGALGEGDIETYKKLSLTAGVMINFLYRVKNSLKEKTQEIDDSDLDFSRRMFPLGETSGEQPAFRALEEGILSLYQLLMFLTSSGIESLSTDDIVRLLMTSESSLTTPISNFTRIMPMGILGRSQLAGLLLVKPIKLNDRGRLVPSSDLFELIHFIQNGNIGTVNRGALSQEINTLGCPMTTKCEGVTPIDDLAKVFFEIYTQL